LNHIRINRPLATVSVRQECETKHKAERGEFYQPQQQSRVVTSHHWPLWDFEPLMEAYFHRKPNFKEKLFFHPHNYSHTFKFFKILRSLLQTKLYFFKFFVFTHSLFNMWRSKIEKARSTREWQDTRKEFHFFYYYFPMIFEARPTKWPKCLSPWLVLRTPQKIPYNYNILSHKCYFFKIIHFF
jgi:hypothetical protein